MTANEIMDEPESQLRAAIREARALAESDRKPTNEASTCSWIIEPLLTAAGYARYDILPQGVDTNNQRPDYTILPDSDFTWYLEAKSLDLTLNDSHVNQSLVYTFTNNRRWVVLTNGREWRLYDNLIQGELAGKLVAKTRLDDEDATVRFLLAIGPASVKGDGIEKFAQSARLTHALDAELSDENSELIKAVLKVLKNSHGQASVNKSQVFEYFRELSEGGVAPSQVTASLEPASPPSTFPTPPNHGYTFRELLEDPGKLLTGRKPEAIVLPGEIENPTSSWVAVGAGTVAFLMRKERLPPLPFTVGRSKKRYFLNSEKKHRDTEREGIFERVIEGGNTVFLDANISAAGFANRLAALLEASRLPVDSVRVRLRV